jgi:hypothetical protein
LLLKFNGIFFPHISICANFATSLLFFAEHLVSLSIIITDFFSGFFEHVTACIIKLDAFRYPLEILYHLCLLCGLVDILVSTDILFFHQLVGGVDRMQQVLSIGKRPHIVVRVADSMIFSTLIQAKDLKCFTLKLIH